MSDRYHKAAIDGYKDLLKEATRKDLNTPDEDGMTPTLWAAYHGHVEALQLICSRGGDPDRSDIWGNTPLHHAAANGHLTTVNFLVNFGANIFALDNDFHTAMDVAASKDRMECVRFLDDAATRQNNQNPKKVAKLKDQATKDAEKRVKSCERVQKKHESKMNKMYQQQHGSVYGSVRSPVAEGTINSVNEHFSKLIASNTSGTLTSRILGTLQKRLNKKEKNTVSHHGGDNVIFVKQEGNTLGRSNLMNMFIEQDESEEASANQDRGVGEEQEEQENEGAESSTSANKESIFKRPGLGNMVFRRNLMGLAAEPEEIAYNMEVDFGLRIQKELFQPQREEDEDVYEEMDGNLPWKEDEIDLDDDDEGETSPLAAFLASLNLVEFTPIFKREQLDLEALMLCSDEDLKSIHIQLGPRKKILEAAAQRKKAMKHSSQMSDSCL
ncbi:ankyrin repeat and SAM domain-containing protein 4B [Polypterus senegalus]